MSTSVLAEKSYLSSPLHENFQAQRTETLDSAGRRPACETTHHHQQQPGATMPPSQLKRLKSSLKEQGIIGPQQSKKQKRKVTHDAKSSSDKRLRRSEALEEIRDQFNPFQYKHNPRGPKFQVTTNKPDNEKGIKGRPGVTLALGEERVCTDPRWLNPCCAEDWALTCHTRILAAGDTSRRNAEAEQSRRHPRSTIRRKRPDDGARGQDA
jgi:hypothetical protein